MIRTNLDNYVITFPSNLVDLSKINLIKIEIRIISGDLALQKTDF